ncbi:MAG: hypothetical protein A3F18_00745 [Legionellales bacterium RIFCSPHIGHO2_12_FULL_37_14]|nr:MAG: hypothetical protein A3F18_00745 [Legionellales bacterium RIFCSPHIGHO2_12_FULL_37_14]
MSKSFKHSRGIVGFFFRFSEWLDVERNTSMMQFIAEKARNFFNYVPKNTKKQHQEFAKAQNEFGLSIKEIDQQAKRLRVWSIILLLFAIVIGAIGVYEFTQGLYLASVVTIIMMGISLIMAFRYHFLGFEMRQRKLGCSFKEWFTQGLMGRKK